MGYLLDCVLGLSNLERRVCLYQHLSQAKPRGISEKYHLLAGVKHLEHLV